MSPLFNEAMFWTIYLLTEYGPGNPAPDDDTTPADLDMMIDLAKQHGGPLEMTTPWGKTWLGQRLNAKGKGLDPLHNPAGMQEDFGAGGGGGGGGFMPNSGSVTQQLKSRAGKGGDDDGNGDTPDRPEDGGFWGADMPGPPELVNPAPLAWPVGLGSKQTLSS